MSQGSRQFYSFICIWNSMPFRCVATEESEANNEKQQAAASTLSMLDWKLSLSFSGFLFVFFLLSLSVFVFSGFRVYLCEHTCTHALLCACVWVDFFWYFTSPTQVFTFFTKSNIYNGMTPNVFRRVEKALDKVGTFGPNRSEMVNLWHFLAYSPENAMRIYGYKWDQTYAMIHRKHFVIASDEIEHFLA